MLTVVEAQSNSHTTAFIQPLLAAHQTTFSTTNNAAFVKTVSTTYESTKLSAHEAAKLSSHFAAE